MPTESKRKIVPLKLVVQFDETTGEPKDAVLLYRTREDGILSGRTFTMSVKAGVGEHALKQLLAVSKGHVEKGEKVK